MGSDLTCGDTFKNSVVQRGLTVERLFSGVERLFSGVVQRGLEIHENSDYVLSLKGLFEEKNLPICFSLPFQQQLAVLPITRDLLGMKPDELKAVLDAAKQRKQRAVEASPAEAGLEGWSNSDRAGGLVKTPQGVE